MTQTNEQRRISGRWVVVALALLAATVPVAVWRTLRWVEARQRSAPLVWDQREAWSSPPVRPTTLQATGIAQFFGGGVWRNLPFVLSPQEEDAVLSLRDLALRRDFASPEVGQAIEAILQRQPELFYGLNLLATWCRLNDQPQRAEVLDARVIAAAPVVLRQRYVDPAGQPIADLDVGSIEIECCRVRNGQLDQSLTLVFPALVTDERGEVFLPLYRTVYRFTSRPHPPGYEATYPPLEWFEAPAQSATMPTATLRPLETDG